MKSNTHIRCILMYRSLLSKDTYYKAIHILGVSWFIENYQELDGYMKAIHILGVSWLNILDKEYVDLVKAIHILGVSWL